MKRAALLAALWIAPSPAAADDAALRAGAARALITPRLETFTDANRNRRYDAGEDFVDGNGNGAFDPVYLAGYGGGRMAMGVHDDLWARALAVSRGRDAVILVALDLVGYLFDEVEAARAEIGRAAGIERSHIFIASTHGHSGPDTIGIWGEGGKSGKDPEYIQYVRKQVVRAALDAWNARKPAKVAFGRTRYSNPIEDSRPPDVKNDLLLAFRVVDEGERTIATLVNYAMHAEVLDGRNQRITADYPGALRGALEKEFGGTALFFPADVGGMQSPFVFFHSFWSMRRVGQALADRVIQSLREAPFVSGFDIAVRNRDLLLPVENQKFLGAIQTGLFGESRHFVKKEGGQVSLPAHVSVIDFGPAQILTVPGELFPELGHALRAKAAAPHKYLFGLCGNEIGYIVPEDQWNDSGYEENMSLGRRTAPLLMQALSDLIPAR